MYKTLARGYSLRKILFSSGDAERLKSIAQPALVALEWSLAEMWRTNNVVPSVVLGHSLGEISAACVAGAMTIDTALELVVKRSKMMAELPANDGVMVAVHCSLEEAQSAMNICLETEERTKAGVGCVNGPNSIVLSGHRDVVEKVLQTLDRCGKFLEVSHAFHSPLICDIEESFQEFLNGLDIEKPLVIPLASTVTGEFIGAGEIISLDHWMGQLCSPVLFENAFSRVMATDSNNVGIIVEIGPKPVLSKMAKGWWQPKDGQVSPVWAASLDELDFVRVIDTIECQKKHCCSSSISGLDLDVVFPNRVRFPWMLFSLIV
jgi:acyl transferase domain-containing protein